MGDPQSNIEQLQAQAKNFDYIWFTLSDLHGIPRGKLFPSRHVGEMLKKGVGFFSDFISFGPQSETVSTGIAAQVNYCNVQAMPVSNKITKLPWSGSEQIQIGDILCEPKWRDGTIVKENPRHVARKQLQILDTMGLKLFSAYENEFSLTKAGKPLYDSTQFCSTLMFNEAEVFMLELEKTLWGCGLDVESLHVENGPGQFEISFQPKYGIQMPDDMFFFKRAVKEMARKHGLEATFMPKVFEGDSNGCHFNHSVWSTETSNNIFYDSAKNSEITQLGKYWIGGLICHMDALTAICCPTVNCYRHLHDSFSGDKKDWDYYNRLVSLRVKNISESATYIESRIPTSASNYYLVMAATVAAGIDGIKKKIEPPPSGMRSDAALLPLKLEDALHALESDEVMVEALGKEFVESFLSAKRDIELDKFGHHDVRSCIPTEIEAERKEYFEMI